MRKRTASRMAESLLGQHQVLVSPKAVAAKIAGLLRTLADQIEQAPVKPDPVTMLRELAECLEKNAE